MQATSLVRRFLQLTNIFVRSVHLEGHDLLVEAAPRWRFPRCPTCGKRARRYDQRRKVRRWRHLGSGASRVWLTRSFSQRVECKRCKRIAVEAVSWAAPGSKFTYAFEETVGLLAQRCDKTTVCKLMGISWATVGRIIGRLTERKRPADPLAGLKRIGVDEFSYRKRHRSLTVVADHDTGRIVWAAPGSQLETLTLFFKELGAARAAEIALVTIDMNAGFQRAIREQAPNARIVFDRFHVQRLGSDALDEVRREATRELRGTPEGRALFGIRFSLLTNPWNRDEKERLRLEDLETLNQPLSRALQLKDALCEALEEPQPRNARRALERWCEWAAESGLRPFQRLARTIMKHLHGIVAYVETRLTNGLVEGLNNKLRVIARRSYGFHGPKPLIAMLFLFCAGLSLDPPLPTPG